MKTITHKQEKTMKVNVMKWLSVFLIAATCVGFVSCGDDDDDEEVNNGGNISKFLGPKRVFGSNLLSSYGREGSTHYELIYDENDFVSKITWKSSSSEGEYKVNYLGNQVIISHGDVKETFTIGSNGYAESYTYSDEWTTRFEYDTDGHMTKLTTTENGEQFIGNLTWQGGNIVKQSDTDSRYATTYEYDSKRNVAGLYPCANLGGDMSEFYDDIYYYIGLIGKGTANLVSSYTIPHRDYDSNGTNTWTLDATGRATKCVNSVIMIYDNSGESSVPRITTYYWNYR